MNKSNFSHVPCFAAKVLDIQPGITAIIGGGGKTTLLYTLARELCQKGSVIVCTSTKIRAPQHIPLFSGESDADLLAGLQQFPVICAAQHTPNGKLCAPACSFAHLAGLADYVLVEADGSRQLPLKAHAAHEPVIPQGCGQVIYLVGADGFNRPISQVCHRPELFSMLTGTAPETVALRTPKGIVVEVAPLFCRTAAEGAECAIEKDGGDDVDVTTGLPVTATVMLLPGTPEVRITGGAGVGRVTKPGLDQPVGQAAINHVPRQMITEALHREAEAACYPGGFAVTISIPGGEEIARRTFNPHIGVEGGLSVLGTSGIVEPMSQQAILDTIQLEMNQAALRTKDHQLILAPGNYGLDYLHEAYPQFADIPVVKTSNFIGDTLDMAAAAHFEQVLLVGHIGKLCKLAGGIMNTHSHTADCRTELFCTHAALCGADREVCTALYNAATTDACLEILDAAGLREPVLQSLLAAIQLHLDRRAGGAVRVGAVLFSNQHGPLGQTETAARLLDEWKE